MSNEMKPQEKKETSLPQGQERTRSGRVFRPTVDIYESKEGLVLKADMPGVDEKGVDITLENDVLAIRGNVSAVPPEGYSLAYSEYGVGDYERTFQLAEEIDRDQIKASIKDGVLKLVLPKAEASRTRKIAVKAE